MICSQPNGAKSAHKLWQKIIVKSLFIHQNFPGQFRHLARALADEKGNEVLAIGEAENLGRFQHPDVRELGYKRPQGAGTNTHHYLRSLEGQVRRGQQIARMAHKLKQGGYKPDIICCHPAWGEGLYLREIWPDTPLLFYFEFFYKSHGLDTGFDPEFPTQFDDQFKTPTRNANHLLSLHVADWGISPTQWQHSTLPPEYQSKVSVIFDGIDTNLVKPTPQVSLTINDQLTLTPQDEVITFVNRNLEPYRGYHIFMRSLPRLMKARPKAQIVILGGDEVSYGRAPGAQTSYKLQYLNEVKDQIDLNRVHFAGRIPYADYLRLLNLSSAHVYLTYPFVLSWSMLEAMSAGCAVVASATPPVQEVIEHEVNGLLFDFFSPDALVDQVCRVLEHPDRMSEMRKAARSTIVTKYDLERVCLPQQLALVNTLAAGKQPPTT